MSHLYISLEGTPHPFQGTHELSKAKHSTYGTVPSVSQFHPFQTPRSRNANRPIRQAGRPGPGRSEEKKASSGPRKFRATVAASQRRRDVPSDPDGHNMFNGSSFESPKQLLTNRFGSPVFTGPFGASSARPVPRVRTSGLLARLGRGAVGRS